MESSNEDLHLPSEVLQHSVMWESPHLPPSLRILCFERQTASCQPADKFTAALWPCGACFPYSGPSHTRRLWCYPSLTRGEILEYQGVIGLQGKKWGADTGFYSEENLQIFPGLKPRFL
ncbi:Hypothetical predicted protein [Marmota monax]|uniref:Uncharacterized protein n=1 Tax=Marmota monax TaxID=9995 RepID=A0A5E4BG57_MARMO|nr:hypothetical protein GHT09_005869 [Marmota monax]VTJ67889.1 Hypothetical predicted protein [Marmota monax]